MNGKERKMIIWLPLSMVIFITMLVLSQTNWGYCAKLPCPPIPLTLGIVAILSFISFLIGVFYFIYGPEEENINISNSKQPFKPEVEHE